MSVIRIVVVPFIGILIASVVIVMPAPEAYAGNCSYHLGRQLCGALKNRTAGFINFTTHLTSDVTDKLAPDLCDVWNWDGGPGTKWFHAKCKQETTNIGGVLGGNGTSYDVDAFTFNNHGYHVRHSRVGQWHWEIKGVWTKIRDDEIADCGIGDNNEVWCTLLFQSEFP